MILTMYKIDPLMKFSVVVRIVSFRKHCISQITFDFLIWLHFIGFNIEFKVCMISEEVCGLHWNSCLILP